MRDRGTVGQFVAIAEIPLIGAGDVVVWIRVQVAHDYKLLACGESAPATSIVDNGIRAIQIRTPKPDLIVVPVLIPPLGTVKGGRCRMTSQHMHDATVRETHRDVPVTL